MDNTKLDPAQIGVRLRDARESAKLTQAAAAKEIGIARTTLVAIEKGERRARTEELQKLARLYGTTINGILRQEAVHVDLVPRFRKLSASKENAAVEAAQLLADLAKAEVELEDLLGVQRHRNYPPERPLLPGDVRAQAESDAQELRQWLGFGLAPVRDLITLLDIEIGIRVYIRPIDGRISGLFAYDEQLGACMLLNAKHPRERRLQTAAHELGHFISARRAPEVVHESEPENSREERYAHSFGRAFMTPARTIMQKFHEITAGATHLTRRHVIVLAHTFGVSREALVRRLEELGLTKPGTWDWFANNGGITNEQAHEVLRDRADRHAEEDRPADLRLNLLAAHAWEQGLLSEGQLARLLRLDRVSVRHLLDEARGEGSEADDAPKLSF